MSLSLQQNEIPVSAGRRGELRAYPSNWSHLADELKRLDLLIKLQVLSSWKGQPTSPLDQFKGLVVSDAEIAVLLRQMSEAADPAESTEAGESDIQVLIDELSRLDSEIEERRQASSRDRIYLALAHLAQVFNLSLFEERCVVTCLAPELDRRYEKLYAWLQDDVTRKKPSVDLVLKLASSGHEERLASRLSFQPHSPLLRYKLIQVSDGAPEGRTPLLSRFLKLEDRIVDYLLGTSRIDWRLEPIASLTSGGSTLADAIPEETRNRVVGLIRSHFEEAADTRPALGVHVRGACAPARRALA
ncbi:MAG: hypothetical protein WAU45_02000, partial [Blastocatellia bacterium]